MDEGQQHADWKLSATIHERIVDRPVEWRFVPYSGHVPFDGLNVIPLYTTWIGMEALVGYLGAMGFVIRVHIAPGGTAHVWLEEWTRGSQTTTMRIVDGGGATLPRALIAAACKAYNVPIE